ncbi:MAG: hypothetical protein AAFR77_12865 [Cyanobacteria bacterium J06631_2]
MARQRFDFYTNSPPGKSEICLILGLLLGLILTTKKAGVPHFYDA